MRGMEVLLDEPDEEEVYGPSGRIYSSTAIFCLQPGHEPRRSAIFLVEWGPFDPIVLTAILLNCGTMAWESPLDAPGTTKASIIGVAEWVFLALFTFEMLAKILAYGFVMHKGSYLRDPWCQLDFVVVTMAWLPILYPALGNYSVLRAFRALRPLRALKRLPGMPVLVQWILDVMPKMAGVFGLCSFVILVFGIVGMELFKGSLHYRCARPGFTGSDSLSQDEEVFDTLISCNPQRQDQCSDGTSCEYFQANPGGGTTSFDSVGIALITLVQAITFDDWANPMFRLSDSFSESVWVYFVLLVMVGGYFILNLFLAVIFLEYEETKSRMAKARLEAAEEEELEAEPMLADSIIRSDTPVAHRATVEALQEGDGYWSCLTTIALSNTLNNGSTFLVLLNIVLMCMPYEGMTPAYASALEEAATAITWSFIAEMVVKLLGLGCEGYWSDQWNVR